MLRRAVVAVTPPRAAPVLRRAPPPQVFSVRGDGKVFAEGGDLRGMNLSGLSRLQDIDVAGSGTFRDTLVAVRNDDDDASVAAATVTDAVLRGHVGRSPSSFNGSVIAATTSLPAKDVAFKMISATVDQTVVFDVGGSGKTSIRQGGQWRVVAGSQNSRPVVFSETCKSSLIRRLGFGRAKSNVVNRGCEFRNPKTNGV